MLKKSKDRVVFFDLDGTLHQQDIFGSFLFWLVFRRPIRLFFLIIIMPFIGCGMLLFGKTARWPVSILLWICTFSYRKHYLKKLEKEFVEWFRKRRHIFPLVQSRLQNYLATLDTSVWLITASPQPLVEQIYRDSVWLPQVNIIASQVQYRYGGWVLTSRCVGREKVKQLEKLIGQPLVLHSGYSDSWQDTPLLNFCLHRWRVTKTGQIKNFYSDSYQHVEKK
jgi:phosphatidylglycerophosphatase C